MNLGKVNSVVDDVSSLAGQDLFDVNLNSSRSYNDVLGSRRDGEDIVHDGSRWESQSVPVETLIESVRDLSDGNSVASTLR